MKWWNSVKDRPVTWGNYATMCKWSTVVVAIIYAAAFLYYYFDQVSSFVGAVADRFKKKKPHVKDEDFDF